MVTLKANGQLLAKPFRCWSIRGPAVIALLPQEHQNTSTLRLPMDDLNDLRARRYMGTGAAVIQCRVPKW